MLKKMFIMPVLILFTFLCVGCVNPYVQKLKTYEMQISQGRDQMFFDAMERLEIERLDVEDQYAKQGLETAMLISAYARITGKTPDDLKASKAFAYDEVLKITQEREAANKKRKTEISLAFQNFFSKVKEQDAKIKAINEGVKKAEEVRDETYTEIGKSALTVVGAAGAAALIIK